MVALFIIIAIVVMLLTMAIIFRNQFSIQQKRVESEYEVMSKLFAKQNDILKQVLPKLSECVDQDQDVSKKISDVLEKQKMLEQDVSMNEAIRYNHEITAISSDIAQYIEKEENLFNKNILEKMQEWYRVKTEIEEQKEMYNSCVRLYNVSISIFPAKYVAKWMKLSKYEEYKE